MPVKSEATRQKILESALGLFREKGFAAATMREIATRAGIASGLAYYYFPSKEDMVAAFYEQANADLQPLLEQVHAGHEQFEARLRAMVETKMAYFAPHRNFLGALMGVAADPSHRSSPFAAETAVIREMDFKHFNRLLKETGTKVAADLETLLPRLLWFYQMGIILFWIYDHSERQTKSNTLLAKSAHIVALLLKASGLPFLRPARKAVVEIAELILN